MPLLRPKDTNLSNRLFQSLTHDQESWLCLVADEASRKHLPLYIVGGFVRDLLLDRPAVDLDLVLEGDAISFARYLAGKYGGKITGHSRFVTATWYLDRDTLESTLGDASNPAEVQPSAMKKLDFISARSETYKQPAALPTVRLGTITDDIKRRDFTINTLAIRLDGDHLGNLRNDLGGLDDLEQGLIRILHSHSFIDDPTRLYRAVRYEQRYGFKISPDTMAHFPEAQPFIGKLSAERIRHELDMMLEEDEGASMLNQLAALKLLAEVHPLLPWDRSVQKRFEKVREVSPALRRSLGWSLWLMQLSRDVIGQIDCRLHFHAKLREEILFASALYLHLSSLTGKKPSQCVSLLDEYPLASVHAVFLAAPEGEARNNLLKYQDSWRHVKPKTTGHTLKKLGMEPGPEYHKILQLLRAAWLNGEVVSDIEENILLEKML